MPNKTQNYKLDYFKQGSYYSASSDYKRFFTLDYNAESFIGIVGVGIISGWEIESVSGLNINVLPGSGNINGFYSESPYTIKQRSDMVAGDREIEVINENDVPYSALTVSERAIYVSVIQLYDPTYNPTGDIENAYVKVVVPYVITLFNNTDTYIYAQRPNGAKPYPLLASPPYPSPAGNPPNRNNYSDYDSYNVALDAYNAKLDAIHNYEWQSDPNNHFTEVNFTTSAGLIESSDRILLGRVVTRNSNVSKIDTSAVNIIANLKSQIDKYAQEFIVGHTHGGNKSFDPPKVRLETDIRSTALKKFDSATGRSTYSILEKQETSITLGHKHTYTVDALGNGQTMDQLGSLNAHFHKISESIVGNPEKTVNFVESHTHTILSSEQQGTLGDWDRYIVYVNGNVFGDETTPYIHVDMDKKQVIFDKGISALNNQYLLETQVTLNSNGSPTTYDFTFESREVSVYYFMLKAINAYNIQFAEQMVEIIDPITNVSNIGLVVQNIAASPFYFNGEGLSDLQNQSSAAQLLFKNKGDTFIFTPNAAKDVPVTLTELGKVDVVTIEFLGNTEVTGKLQSENILYINANKFLLGEFIPEVIPFVSHIGRLKENCVPLQYSMVSSDGVRYTVTPTITDSNLGHTHRLLVDTSINGTTSDVLVGNIPVYYESDSSGNDYLVLHYHGTSNAEILSSESQGLLNWQNNVSSANLTSSVHTHNIIYPVIGNNKTIYAIKEDIEGNIYVGTSDGFIIIPSTPAYLFVINGVELYFYGNDLWSLLGKAKEQYEKETTNPFTVTEALYRDAINSAETTLLVDGDSVLLYGTPHPDRQTDQIMIQRISSFKLPDFKYTVEKKEYEVLSTETIIAYVPLTAAEQLINAPQKVIVERNFEDTPIWSIAIGTSIDTGGGYIASTLSTDVFVTGSNLVAKSVGINKSSYQPWNSINVPFSIGIMRKTIKDYSGSYWICTNNGVLVSRSYSLGGILEVTSLPAGNPDIKDILEGEVGAILCASSSGIFKTTDGGKTWAKLIDVINGFNQIIRDMSLDKTNVVSGHYHNFETNIDGTGFLGESIGSGINHVHTVTNWQVADTMGHTHTIITTMYAADNSKIIWKSVDNGLNWIEYGLLPDGECGNIFAAFNCLFISQSDGVYKSSNGHSWSLVLNTKAYSHEWSYDMSELMIGCNNVLYGTFDGITFEPLYSFQGNPYSILLRNNVPKYFEYAYSNSSQTFHFKDLVVTTDNLTALVDFEKWYASGGSWSNSYLYDVYINYKRILSTKYNEDKRLLGNNFEVFPSEGMIDFSASSQLFKNANIYDVSITLSDVQGFNVGDSIVILSNNSSTYVTIDAINTNELTISPRLSKNIVLPASVTKIPNMNGDSSLLVNIYNSLLSNIGKLTHDQVEDGLSNYSDGRPYKFNNTYLSNLLQITQAIRYVYPDINSEFVNDLFYDFRYSWSSVDPLYPSIYDYIDVITSETYNQKIYDSNFTPEGAKSINKILVGYGAFAGNIIVATDIGIFIANLTTNYEANWKYVNDLPFTVYDLIIFGSDVLLTATANGTYKTIDLKTWTLESAPSINYPSYSLGLRWSDKGEVTVASHIASFVSNVASDTTTITSLSGNVYEDFVVNQGIKISNASSEINGGYIISSISDGGTGFGSQIVVSPYFNGEDVTISGVTMTMGSWWGQWDGDVNTSNSNLTNTLLVGGKNHISYNDGGEVWAWIESSFVGASNFISRKFTPLSNGRALLAATGNNAVNQKNYLFKSDDIGKTWNIFRDFNEIKGNIDLVTISDFNNTILNVTYTYPSNFIYVNGIMDQQDIAIFARTSTIALFRGKIVWNEVRNKIDQIIVYGSELYNLINSNVSCSFVIYPSKVNTIVETNQETLFFGTDRGLYYDVNSVVSNLKPQGQIKTVGYNGKISKIDISGKIISLDTNSSTNQAIVYIEADTNIRKNYLIGKYLYVTDVDPVEKYVIADNSSVSPGEESSIEIQNIASLPSSYVGKKIRIIGDVSRVYVDFELPVLTNQFANGKAVSTSLWSNNFARTYTITESTTDSIDLDVAILPSSTLVKRLGEETLTTTTTTLLGNTYSLVVGQDINVLDSSGKLTLWVTFDKTVSENSMAGLELDLNNIDTIRNVGVNTISSNLDNSITINSNNVFSYISGDEFSIKGALYEQLGGFSHLLTSIVEDHYHDVETVNAMVSGKISSFGFNNASYIDINVTNTVNFNTAIVQLRGDLFKNAQIVFTNNEYINLRYISEVVSHTASSIRVKFKSSDYWDLTSVDSTKISVGWVWEIDATNYGYANNLYYNDFNVLSYGITNTINSGSDLIKLTSTVGINVGDKIRIQDDTLSYEISYVSQVVDAYTIKVSPIISRTYFIKRNPQLKVLRDVFANILANHTHQIRNNEVEVISVEPYLDRGYSLEHSHRVLPLVTDVSVLLNKNNSVYAFGSSSIIYKSTDNGLTWQQKVNLNDFLEGSEEVTGISAATFNNDKMVVGATSGNIFAETSEKFEIISLGGII